MANEKSKKEQKPRKNQPNNPPLLFSSEWIASDELLQVFAGLWTLSEGSDGQIDGSSLAKALQRLVRAEIAPGGPYADPSGTVDPLANAAIALFLRGKGIHLPALEPFLAQFKPEDLERQLRASAPHVVATPRMTALQPTAVHKLFLTAINARVRADMATWPDLLATMGEQMFSTLLHADTTGEIRLMPRLFANSLTTPPKIDDDQLTRLGAANVFFWIGGMLFDDFLDEEGKPELLPVATVSHRHALALYRQVTVRRPELYEYIEASCLRADQANAWEVMYTRAQVARGVIKLPELPGYGDHWALADRSIGHLFGPLLIARQLPSVTDVQFAQIEHGLRHYLIARQLNDDIHDWRKDLRTGQLSAVVVELLRGAGILPGSHKLTTLVPKIEQYFMDEGLRGAYDLFHEHVVIARESLEASGLIIAAGGLMDLITRQESAMHAALETKDNYQQFLTIFATESEP